MWLSLISLFTICSHYAMLLSFVIGMHTYVPRMHSGSSDFPVFASPYSAPLPFLPSSCLLFSGSLLKSSSSSLRPRMLGKTLVFLFHTAQLVELLRFEKRRRKGDLCLGLDRVLLYLTRRSGNCGHECSRNHILGLHLQERRFSAIRTTRWRTLFVKFIAEYYLALSHFSQSLNLQRS